jgi:hypothetical protein
MSANEHLSPAQFRWMHHGEYESAATQGHFRRGINASSGAPDDRYQAGDHMLVGFKSAKTWEPKEDGSTYTRARGEVPFGDAVVLQVNPMVPKHVSGPRPTKDTQGHWQPAYKHSQ